MALGWPWGGFWVPCRPSLFKVQGSRFDVRCSTFDVQPTSGTSNAGKPPAARVPQAWLILRGPAEAGVAQSYPRESPMTVGRLSLPPSIGLASAIRYRQFG